MIKKRSSHERNKSQECATSDIWSDCHDELSVADNSILDFSQQSQVEGPKRVRKKAMSIPTKSRKGTSRRQQVRSGSGAASKTPLGPASAMTGGHQEWNKFKQCVRGLAAAQRAKMPVHTSELV